MYRGHTAHGLCTIFVSKSNQRSVSILKLKMDKSSYKSAENYLGKGEKATVILAEPQVLKQWDDVAKKYTDTITGYKYTFTFDGAEDVLVVKFANKQDIKQWDVVTFENLEVFEDIRKNAAYFRAEGVRKHG